MYEIKLYVGSMRQLLGWYMIELNKRGYFEFKNGENLIYVKRIGIDDVTIGKFYSSVMPSSYEYTLTNLSNHKRV
jgi:hypothetical protein